MLENLETWMDGISTDIEAKKLSIKDRYTTLKIALMTLLVIYLDTL